MYYMDDCPCDLGFCLYIAYAPDYKLPLAFVDDKGIRGDFLRAVYYEQVAVEYAHPPVAVCVHCHENGCGRMPYAESVQVEFVIFIALCRTWESCYHCFCA